MKRYFLILPIIVFFLASCQKKDNPSLTGKPDQTTIIPVKPLTDTVAPVIQWQKSLGGSNNDVANSIQPTADGGYIVAGYSLSNDGDVSNNHGNEDFWVVKLNSTGSIAWQKSYGGSSIDIAYSIKQTTDGGYIVAGQTYSNDGDVTNNISTIGGSFWVLKLSSAGSLQWQKCLALNAVGSGATDIQQTADGGFVVAGNGNFLMPTSSYGDVLVIKLTSTGSIEWSQPLGGGYHDNARSIKQTTDGGYIVAGATASTDGDFSANHNMGAATYDYYITKINSTGRLEWQKIYGGKENDEAYAVQQTTDGGYIVTGYSESTDGNVTDHHGYAGYADYWLLKLTATGAIQWQKSLGGTGNDVGYSVQQTSDGGYIAAGYTKGATDGDVTYNHNTGTTDYWIVKMDNAGSIKWQKSFGGGSFDDAHSIKQTIDGGFIVAGQSFSNDGDVSGNHGAYDFWVLKLK
jgi:hypothetical protein